MDEIECRPIQKEDSASLLELLLSMRPTVARLSNPAVYRAIAYDAPRDPLLFVVVACLQGRVIGYMLAMRNWRRFWRRFFLRHPGVAIQVAWPRIQKQRQRKRRAAAAARQGRSPAPRVDPITQDPSLLERYKPPGCRKWEEDSPEIVKGVHVGVAEAFRGRGVGGQIYRTLFVWLEQSGVKRFDGNVDAGNTPSIRMHIGKGWMIARHKDGYFVTIDIPPKHHQK
jgi:GNAT superfamily N-acetyltransferase